MQIQGNTILITGGASGIGFGLTERFLQEGNNVLVCGRRQEKLSELKAAHPAVHTLQCDINVPSERERLYSWVIENFPALNILVNNAGIQKYITPGEENFMQEATEEITTNIEAVLHLTDLFLHHKALNTIMNVTSGLSFVPFTKVPVYSATKAFMHSFTLSLRALVEPKHIEVIEIIPPGLNTDLGAPGLHDHFPSVNEFIDSIFKQLIAGKNALTFGTSTGRYEAEIAAHKNVFEIINGTSKN